MSKRNNIPQKGKNSGRSAVNSSEKQGRIVHHQITQISSGPLPPPAVLESYERILPGAAERIMKQFEKQVDHRISMEKLSMSADNRASFLGLISAFIIAMGGGWLGYLLIAAGQTIEGSLFAGGTLVSLVTAFIYGTKAKTSSSQNKS